MMNRYPRDMSGHRRQQTISWPNNAKIAVQFVVNYEEGGENCLLHGDSYSEAFLSEIVVRNHGPDNVTGTWKAYMIMARVLAFGGFMLYLPLRRFR